MLCRQVFLILTTLAAFSLLLHPGRGSDPRSPTLTTVMDQGLPARISFNEHVQPILSENCYACHGPDSSTREASLRLDHREFAIAAHDDFDPAIVPGKPDQSPLVERIINEDPEERMPPLNSHKSLKPFEISLLKRWIAEGAVYEQHWSLIPPARPPAPASASGWARNPIDTFVEETLAASGLKPNREEQPARLLRRAALDLTGLPPTSADLAAFEKDPSPDAYERAIDRLLASDACAEHFTRAWLDVVRYGDTHGIHIDNYRSIWPYRDWVIAAYRRNLPFDQFTIEQMAGDMLPNATLVQKVASGFNRCLPTTSEGGAILPEYEAIYAKDRVETMSAVWLGLTTGCAACHDHKFDPITTRDFYSLTAFFRNNTMPVMDGNVSDTAPSLLVPAPADHARWPELEKESAALTAELKTRAAKNDDAFEHWLASGAQPAAQPLDHTVALHLPLNETAGRIQISGARPLPQSSIEPERIEGPFGLAPKINGVDWVISDPIPIRREGEISFGLWIRVEGKPSGTLLSCLNDDDRDHGWEIVLNEGKPGIRFSNGSGSITAKSIARPALVPAQWHHLILVYDGAPLRNRLLSIYVDSKEVSNAAETSGFGLDLAPRAPLRLGARHSSGGGPANGLKGGSAWVQDFRYYARAFSSTEVRMAFGDIVGAREAIAVNEADRTPAQWKVLKKHFFASADAPSLEVLSRLDRLAIEEEAIRSRGGITLVMVEKKTEPFAHVLIRGEYANKGEKVPAAVPAVLPQIPAGISPNRLSLAHWLVAAENPLTARVTVNRAWQYIFGTGLVESSGDFGVTGARPSHPRLLDWLAVEFRESGWDYRRLLRLLVTSATYRQSAAATPELIERDPENRLLARGPRHRLDAEVIRDQALAASGLLVPKIGGRSVRPYQPEGIWEEVAMKESTTRFYPMDEGENLYRRSLYTFWKRTAPPPAMDVLNAPSREVTCVRRDRTNTPLQALVTLNETLFVEASRHLAARALRTSPAFDACLDTVSLALLGRAFSAPERTVLRRTFERALSLYRSNSSAAKALLTVGVSPSDPDLPAADLAAWTIVASQVMNLDEALTK